MRATAKIMGQTMKDSGWLTVKTNIGNFSLGPKTALGVELQIGETYDLDYMEKDPPADHPDWSKNRIIQKALLKAESNGDAQEAPSAMYKQAAPAVHSNGGKNESLMARMAASKNAALLAQSYASMIVAGGLAIGETKETLRLWIDAYRKETFEAMLRELNG